MLSVSRHKLFLWFCHWNAFIPHKGQPPFKKFYFYIPLLFYRLGCLGVCWVTLTVHCGTSCSCAHSSWEPWQWTCDPAQGDRACAHWAARGNQPLSVLPGRLCPKPGVLPLAPGSDSRQESCPAARVWMCLVQARPSCLARKFAVREMLPVVEVFVVSITPVPLLELLLLCFWPVCICGQSFSLSALWELVPSSHVLGLH